MLGDSLIAQCFHCWGLGLTSDQGTKILQAVRCGQKIKINKNIHRINFTLAPHSSTLAWKILWMEEPGGLQSMGSLRVRHDWATSLSLFTFLHWRRQWQPTPVFFPGESQGWGSLVGCRLWGCTESDTTEVTQQQQQPFICQKCYKHLSSHSVACLLNSWCCFIDMFSLFLIFRVQSFPVCFWILCYA